ncbi:preprotein translocase subunit SecG [Desulfurivibrio dismutans]|uniref:preprotein translocase subunit SecG n=1 Tax=Desulfurivibrio dismutans TaxID=1398908 RepID=UPI0023DBFC2F|nr:preprotein translocase subunit SecG [Desulfurivibrio alkaliphilus]MDF1614181.1 preprotein translocase subunit SecG [Desulfurivibrio alkaliphilus]
MYTVLIVFHILVCLFLVTIVLLQHGKGASIGASFGGSSQTVFGTEGPLPMMNKITTMAAVVFMITSISLAYISSRAGDGSVMERVRTTPAPIEEALPESDEPVTIPLPGASDGEVPRTFPGEEQ